MNTWLFRLFADYVKIDWCTYLISDCGGCKDRARICSETSHRSTVRRFAVYRKPDCSRRYTQSPRHREPHHLVRMMLLRPPQQRPLLLPHSIAGRIGTGQCSSAQGSLRMSVFYWQHECFVFLRKELTNYWVRIHFAFSQSLWNLNAEICYGDLLYVRNEHRKKSASCLYR